MSKQMMAVFKVTGRTRELVEQYDRLMQELPAAHLGRPQVHICAASPEGLLIVDIWESPEALERFASDPRFIALRAEVGLPDPEVTVLPVHRAGW